MGVVTIVGLLVTLLEVANDNLVVVGVGGYSEAVHIVSWAGRGILL